MATNTEVIHARIEPKLKRSVETIFGELGLSTTEAVRLFFRQVEIHRGLPFEVRIPNAETRATFAATDAGKGLRRARDAKELFAKLGI